MRLRGEGTDRIKLITHADLDAAGSAVLAKVVFGNIVDINMEMTSTAEKTINNFLDDTDNLTFYKRLYITDLSISEELANKIEVTCSNYNIKFRLFDHHNTSINLNERQWCTVIESDSTCGTSLFYDYLVDNVLNKDIVKKLKKYKEFVTAITLFDTGNWAKEDSFISNQLNMLLRVIGKQRFIERFTEDPNLRLSVDELAVLQLEQERIDRYIYSHKFTSFVIDLKIPNLGEYQASVCYANDCYMEMFQMLFDTYPEIDIAILINIPYGISYRLRDNPSSNIDLSKIAEFFGGGGHKESAGSKISLNIVEQITKMIFENYIIKTSVIKTRVLI